VSIDSPQDLAGLKAAGAVVAAALREMEAACRPGVSTLELDAIAGQVFRARGARSAPKLVYDFPGETCISVNEEAVHGIPGSRLVAEGDLVKLDVTCELDGYYADAARTVRVGAVSADAERVSLAAREALAAALEAVRPGALVSDIGARVEKVVEAHGCRVLRPLTGHGIGRSIHEDPAVPNHHTHSRDRLHEGMVLTVEPIISLSSRQIARGGDGWTVKSGDGSLSAHWEHTVVVTAGDPLVLTV
jgi:methionyl aminopeptidase